MAALAVVAAVILVGHGSASAENPQQPAAASVAVHVPSQQEIAALFAGWNQALATLDPQRVADRYAPDAVLLPTLSNEVRADRARIVDYFEHFLLNKPQGAILQSHIKVLGPNSAVDSGTYRFTLSGNGPVRTVDARYTFVYERVGGKWLIISHHSSAMPES